MEKETNSYLKGMLTGIGVIFLYLIAYSFPIEFINSIGINYYKLSPVMKQLATTLYELGLTLIIIYIYRKDFIPNFKDFFKNIKSYLDKYFKYWILVLVLMITSNIIISPFTTLATSENQQAVIDSLKSFPIYTIIFTIITGPILEELVFRLSFRKIFKHSKILFIIFSGLIFGALHVVGSLSDLSNLLFIIPYSIPGFIFAYVYAKSDNIAVPISLHFIHNTVMVLLQLIVIFK